MTIVTTGSDEVLEQITKQLNKLVDVVKVVCRPVGGRAHRARADADQGPRHRQDREEMKRMADIFRGRIIDVTDSTYVVEVDRLQQQARFVHQRHRHRPDSRNRSYRRQRHRPRRPYPQNLIKV